MGSSGLERSSSRKPEPKPGQAASPRRLARIVVTAVVAALAVVTLGLVLALWGLGLTAKISQSTSEVLDLVKLGFALVAGIGGTVGLVLAYQRHLIAVEAVQREQARETREDTKERREDTKLFNERFGKAAEQLSSDQYANKLAGAYAMAKLADDWDDGRQTCINVLCANLRRGYAPKPPDSADPADLLAFSDNREFRHTIIAVICTRLRDGTSPWQGHNFDFHDTRFDGGDFGGAIFSGGNVNFAGATFSGGTVNFFRTTFPGGIVIFGGATFSGGNVIFGAMFSGGTVNFMDTRFSGGTVDFDFAVFSGGIVNFGGATFSGGTVDFQLVNDFSVPPRFDFLPDTVPVGVVLPARPKGGADVRLISLVQGRQSFSGSPLAQFARSRNLRGTTELRLRPLTGSQQLNLPTCLHGCSRRENT